MDINSVITREEYDKVGNLNYDQFCDYMMRIVKLCVEESLRSLPAVMTHLSSQASYLKNLSDKFYSNNKDLNEHRMLMAQTIEKVESENPGKSYEEILDVSAKRAREAISKLGNVTSFNPKNLQHFDSKLKEL